MLPFRNYFCNMPSIFDPSLLTGGAVTILNACVCSVVPSSHRLLDTPLVWVLCKQKIITALNLTCTLFLHGAWVDQRHQVGQYWYNGSVDSVIAQHFG